MTRWSNQYVVYATKSFTLLSLEMATAKSKAEMESLKKVQKRNSYSDKTDINFMRILKEDYALLKRLAQ
jgi:hypothetical protein